MLSLKEQWTEVEMSFPPDSVVCFTNGSTLSAEGHSGAGVYVQEGDIKASYALGRYATVFQTEVYALLSVARTEAVVRCRERRVFICSDSQTSLKPLCSAKITSPLVRECVEALEHLARTKEVSLMWVPEHCGIKGNEVADEFARHGANPPCQGPVPYLGITRKQKTSALNE